MVDNLKKNVGICTLYTGYNLGSALQAYALKTIINDLGYNAKIIKLSGSLIKGRDVRIKKLFVIFIRMLLYSKNKSSIIKSYREKEKNNEIVISEFCKFYAEKIIPYMATYGQLKKEAKSNEYLAYVCGSDQIWSSTSFYVDPFYYLDFAPDTKKIAYAPSFGKSYIPDYNAKKIKKYLNKISYISVREDSGKKIIKDLLEKEAPICLDPTLLLDEKKWCEKINTEDLTSNYILCYFLSKPNDKALKFINEISLKYNLKVIYINSDFGDEKIFGGPETFINYMKNARVVITDSFHGVAFSINFHKNFYVFDRQYIAENQSTRITSLLKIVKMENVFECENEASDDTFDYDMIDKILDFERNKSIKYLKDSLENIDNG